MLEACKNCQKPTHPTYIRKYHGFCLECSNAGVDEMQAAMDELKAEVARLKAEVARLNAGLRELSGVDDIEPPVGEAVYDLQQRVSENITRESLRSWRGEGRK